MEFERGSWNSFLITSPTPDLSGQALGQGPSRVPRVIVKTSHSA